VKPSPRSSLLAGALLAAVLAACGSKPPAANPSPTPTPTDKPTPTDTPTAPPVAEGPTAQETLDWVLATITAGGKVTVAEVEARFSPGFLKVAPAASVVEIFAALGTQLPPMKVLKQADKAPLGLDAVLDTASGGVRVTITMTKSTPRKIEGLLFAPATAEAPPRTYGDAVGQLQAAGSKSQLFIAEIDKGACKPLQNHHTTDQLAIGSAFKLWVLLGLDEKLATSKGKLTWDTKLKIRDEAKSLPSGELQDVAAGTELTVREFATKMISISDNTATDHLIDLVGRESVEKALKLAKHTEPARDIPFMRTRELFALKLAVTPAEVEAYRKLPVAAKRKLLDTYRTKPIVLEDAAKGWTSPRLLDLEWFASGVDLCNVMATLGTRAKWKPDAELLTILGKNAGVPYDKSKWSYVGFKGGSEPGVINLTWLAQRSDGRWFVAVVAVNDDQKMVDEGLVINAATGVLAILGNEAPAKP
jgi:beta-lactamase class A